MTVTCMFYLLAYIGNVVHLSRMNILANICSSLLPFLAVSSITRTLKLLRPNDKIGGI